MANVIVIKHRSPSLDAPTAARRKLGNLAAMFGLGGTVAVPADKASAGTVVLTLHGPQPEGDVASFVDYLRGGYGRAYVAHFTASEG